MQSFCIAPIQSEVMCFYMEKYIEKFAIKEENRMYTYTFTEQQHRDLCVCCLRE